MMRSFAPLADRTRTSLQQQNMVEPSTPKSHNPYAFSVIPENPDEVMFHRSLSQMQDQYSSIRSPFEQSYSQLDQQAPVSTLSRHNSVAEYPPTPLAHYGSFSASPYQDAIETLTTTPVPKAPAPVIGLTKVYVGGRPVAVPFQQPQQPAVIAHAPHAREEEYHPIPNNVIATVRFRRHSAKYFLRDVASVFQGIKNKAQMLGRYVIVEGDRGEDLGKIVVVDETEKTDGRLHVKRVATKEESHRWETTLRNEELRALEYAQQQALRLFTVEQLKIEDATFQYDKQKLTLWYHVPDRVYFVPLLKSLNQAYRCRIWMERCEESQE